MNNKHVIGIAVAAFILGDLEGVVRSNIAARRVIRKHKREKEILALQVIALTTMINNIITSEDPEAAALKFLEDKKFIDIIQDGMS